MPSITLNRTNSVTRDTYLSSAAPTSTYIGVNPIDVGTNDIGYISRALVFFDLGLIPNDAIINSASLSLYKQTGVNSRKINMHKITSNWDANTTWDTTPSFDPAVAGTATPVANAAFSIDVKAVVQEWVSGQSANNGIILKQEDEATLNTLVNLSSFENGTVANRPQLTIDYTIPTTGKKQVEYVGTTVAQRFNSTSSITLALPTGIATGDLLVAFIASNVSDTTIVPANGWAVQSSLVDGNSGKVTIAYKFAAANETAPTFTISGGAPTSFLRVAAYRNVKGIIDFQHRAITGSTTFYPKTSSITVAIDKAFAILFNDNWSAGAFTPPLGFTEIYDSADSGLPEMQSSYKYLHLNRTQTTTDLTTTAPGTYNGYSGVMFLEPNVNNPPTLTLTNPADNQT
ncbi:DNRLRE domain-containing protein, partial [Brevibacillus centrosporus]